MSVLPGRRRMKAEVGKLKPKPPRPARPHLHPPESDLCPRPLSSGPPASILCLLPLCRSVALISAALPPPAHHDPRHSRRSHPRPGRRGPCAPRSRRVGGRQAGPTISRRDSWNAGKRSGKCIPSADSLSAQKLSPRQTTQHRLLELSSSAPCSLFSTKHIVTEHLRHHAIATEEVHLKAMCLLLSARFRVDSADVFF